MNKNRFRIVFNAARGLRVAVAECARSFGKASTTVCAAVTLFAPPLLAQIVADPGAPSGQRPTVLAAPNGVPLVNIQTPSAAGVSRNTYSQFDVNAQGAILNNSRTNAQTQLGGWVQGNPWLATGGARVILNEVNSAHPSQLRGFVEVAGQRAEVIIANPAGINVNGGGFINASRATLTTGTPIMNGGSLDGYRVQRGSVTLGGAGLDARHTDHTAVLARAIEVNAGIWANDLKLVTGANDVGADQTTVQPQPAGTGTAAPAFALDVAHLGGMYAGKITLVGTEAGVGVRNAGTIGATAGDVALDVNGWLSNRGSIHASGNADVRVGGGLTNDASGLIAAGLNADGTVAGSAGHLTLNAQGGAALQGSLLSTGNMRLEGAQLNLREVVLSAKGQLSMRADTQLVTDGAQLQAAAIEAQAASVSNRHGEWVQTDPTAAQGISVVVAGALDNTQGRIAAAGDLDIAAQSLTNDRASLQAQGDVRIDTRAGRLFNRAGRITSQGSLALQTGELINATDNGLAAAIGAAGNLSIQATALHNLAGPAADGASVHSLMWSDAAMAIEAGSVNNQASLVAERSIALDAGTFDNRGTVSVNSGSGGIASTLLVRADTLNNRPGGALFADHVAIEAREINNRPDAGGANAPVIAARTRLDLGVHTLHNEDGALLYSSGSMGIGNALDAALAATGRADNVNNLSAEIEAAGDLSIAARALRNERRNASVSQVQVVDQTAHLNMPSWWVNGQNRHGVAIEGTSNYSSQLYYLLDPASILSDTQLVTPDGYTVRRIEVALDPTDSVYHAASGAYNGDYGVRERVTVGAATTVLYVLQRQDGVGNPDQLAGAPDVFAADVAGVTTWQRDSLSYSSAYGRCTTNCTLLVVQPGYSDPQSIILRGTHRALTSTHPGLEVSRTAHHTAVEDRLNAGAGATASIRSGGDMHLDIATSLTNRYADIQAGATLDVQAAGATVVNQGQTLLRTHRFQITSHSAGQGSFDWTNSDINEVIGHAGGTISGAQQLSITAQDLSNTDLARSTGLPTTGLGFLGVSLPDANAPITVPGSALFQPARPGSGYLIESDPRFTDHRQWLGSDYLLGALAIDPAATQKRLGDGFYEQKLIREQVAQLTGRRFLEGYASEEAQYQALMDSGLAYAQAWNLVPGIALTAEQMAQLTTDLVWLVEREVVLPDGTKTMALVPQVYVRQVPEGELLPSGALLAGHSVSLQIAQDLVNAGGRIEGGVVIAQAGRDLSNIGGLMQARSELLASGGRNVTISSPTHTTSFSGAYVEQSRTELAGVGAMRVGSAPGAKLSIEAAQDVVLQAASISNAGVDGSTTIRAGRDVLLQTVEVGSSDNTEYNARNYQRHSNSQEVGTSVAALGDIAIRAGNDVVARAASVEALGNLSVQAGNHITLEAGRSVSESASSVVVQRKGLMGSKTTEHAEYSASDVAVGSALGGRTVTLEAGQDIAVRGSAVIGDQGTTLVAGDQVSIEADQNRYGQGQFHDVRKSGVFTSGASITLGSQQKSTQQQFEQTAAAASTVGAITSDVTVIAGGIYQQSGSDVLAPGGDINISAQSVQIIEARETSRSDTEHKFKQSGLTLAISSPVISAIQTISSQVEAAGKIRGSRMQGLAAANSAFAARNAASAVQAGQGVDFAGKSNQIVSEDAAGNMTNRDATAAEQAGGINLSISIGSSKSQSNSTETRDTARGSTVAASGNVNITASGAGQRSGILIQGSELSAGGNATLSAEGDVSLLAAQNTESLSGSNKSSSGSIGISLGTSGFGVTASASAARGGQAGNDLTQTNTHITAGNTARIQSGGDTTLQGALVRSETIRADVGGNLWIESLQDTSTYDSHQKSASASVTIGAGAGGALSASKSKVKSDFASVTGQSGLKAGDGGFQVNVQGDTNLKGGAITSTQAAIEHDRNSFSTGGALGISDVHNKADYSAKSTSVGVGTGMVGQNLGMNGLGAGVGSDKGSASSTTTAGISGIAGDVAMRSTDAETGIQRIFEKERVQQEIEAQAKITETFSRETSKAVSTYTEQQRKALHEKVRQAQTEQERQAVQAQMDEVNLQERVLNVLIGAVTGAAGAALTQETLSAAADQMRQIMIEDSSKFAGVTDGFTTLGNLTGESEGVRGDRQKLGGTRVDLDGLCGSANERCKVNNDGTLALNAKGQVQFDSVKAEMSLEDFLKIEQGKKLSGLTGGLQGAKGTLFGIPYLAGSWQDGLIEAFGGTHDMIGGKFSGLYDKQGNAMRGRSNAEKVAQEVWSGVALVPSAPFAAAELLPSEAWKAIAILLNGAR